MRTNPPAAKVLTQLGYGQVQLAQGPLQRQSLENHRLLLGLDENSLLRPFRMRAGLTAPGEDLGGWYDTHAFAPGATFGQWVSALSRYHAITGDPPTQHKVHRLIRAYAATIRSDGRFYQNNRFPAYIYDKLVGGLVDACVLGGAPSALRVLDATTQAALPFLPPAAVPRNEHSRPGEDYSQHAWDESYTLPENQFFAWQLTGDDRHRTLAQRFLYDEFFSPLAQGNNVLPGKHAYSHVSALSSALQAYLSLDQPKYLEAARQGFTMVAAQSYATGGWGPDEHFIMPDTGALGESLVAMSRSFETPCGAYAHLKLTRYLLRITRDPRYGDSMERVLYNTVLGALPLQPDGRSFYYSDYTSGAKKRFHWDRWPCCSGTLPLSAADYGISTCFVDAEAIYVNLYVPAKVTWRHADATCDLEIRTHYPQESAIVLILNVPADTRLSLHLRIPAWATGARVRINGGRELPAIEPATFATIRRQWHPGDRVELELPLMLRLESVDKSHPDTVALLAGPLVLTRVRGAEPLHHSPLSRTALLSARRLNHSAHDWRAHLPDRVLTLRPFVDIGEESYSVYQQVIPH